MIPENGVDANFIGCNLVTQIYTLKQQKLSPSEKGVIAVTMVGGGLGVAMISENFHITGSLRMI
jgi:metal-dependent amidase/aminoacylase/carboxypeptidase family protein